jgi:hypothetical protein
VNEQYIEFFDIDLVTLPVHLPTWFTHQIRFFQNVDEISEFEKVLINPQIKRRRDKDVQRPHTNLDCPGYSLMPATYGRLISEVAFYDPSKSIIVDDGD